MDRIAARNIVRRVLLATLSNREETPALPKKASLPTGGLLIGLDMLARAQFLEGLAGKPFNSISSPAGSSKARAKKVIEKILHLIDPTLDLNSEGLNVWTSEEGSSGLYKSAWLGANRALGRTHGPTGPGFEATDVLTANMLRYLDDPSEEAEMSESALEEFAETASLEEKLETLKGQEKALRDAALRDAAEAGNFFWVAGKKSQSSQAKILSGEIGVDRLGGLTARYAFNYSSNMASKMETQQKALAAALRIQMIPGETRKDFDLGELTPTGWGYIIQEVLANPDHHFSQEVFDWMLDDVKFHPNLNDKEKQVMTAYVRAVIDGRLSGFLSTEGTSAGRGSDRGFVEDYNRRNPDAAITPNYFGVVKNKYLGKDGAEISKRLHDEAPGWKLDAEDFLFLMNAQKGRGKFAALKVAAEEALLRSKVIRLAHRNPELRSVLIPLLKAGEGLEAGR